MVVKLIVTIDSWLDLASNPGFCTTLALAQFYPKLAAMQHIQTEGANTEYQLLYSHNPLVMLQYTISQSSWNPPISPEIPAQSEAQTGREYGTRPYRRPAESLPVCASDCLRISDVIQDRCRVQNQPSADPKSRPTGAQTRGTKTNQIVISVPYNKVTLG